MKLGIDSYSLRNQGWDAFQMLDYAAEAGLDGVQFSEARRELASFEPDYLAELLARADALDLYLEVGTGSFCRLASSFDPSAGSGEDQLGEVIGVPGVRFNLEIFTGTGERAHGFYAPDFWAAFPATPAADFARFVQLAARGKSYERQMVVVRRGESPPESTMRAFAAQQLADFEQSVRYCIDVLGLGERGRSEGP